jgi:hypothetical protein
MSFLSSSGVKRQVALVCVRLLAQCVMASSIPQAGMDEVDVKSVRTNKTPMSVMSGHDRRPVCRSPRLSAELHMQLPIVNKDYQQVRIQSDAGSGPGGASMHRLATG